MPWLWPELWLFLVLFAWWLWGLSLTIRSLLAMANARIKKWNSPGSVDTSELGR